MRLDHLLSKEKNLHTILIIYGGIAQLGERLPCKQEVRSSTLLTSTRQSQKAKSPSLDSEKNHENCKIKIMSINQISRMRNQEKKKKDKITGKLINSKFN